MDHSAMTAREQKGGFRVLFLTEMWERFGFYTIASVLVLYMSKALHYSDTQAYGMYAAFTALLFVTPLLGGYLADRVIGFKRTLLLGVLLLTTGYIFLALPGKQFMLLGLSCVVFGGGVFKSMPYALLGKLYAGQKEKFDSRFTMYYLSINIGGIPALLFSGYIAHLFGWNIAFAVAAAGLVVAGITYTTFSRFLKNVGNDFDKNSSSNMKMVMVGVVTIVTIAASYFLLRHQQITDVVAVVATVAVFAYIFYLATKFSRAEQKRLMGVVVLMVFAIAFWGFYYQQPTSMVMFVDRNVDHHFFGMFVPSSSFWVFNPIWILALGPVLSYLYLKLNHCDPSIATKFAIGLIIMSFGYFILTVSAHFANTGAKVSGWWVACSYGFQGCAELLVNALGLGMVAKLVPQRIVGLMIGAWWFTGTLGSLLAGKLADLSAVSKNVTDPHVTLSIYSHSFTLYGWICLAVGIVALALVPVLKRLLHASDETIDDVGGVKSAVAYS